MKLVFHVYLGRNLYMSFFLKLFSIIISGRKWEGFLGMGGNGSTVILSKISEISYYL